MLISLTLRMRRHSLERPKARVAAAEPDGVDTVEDQVRIARQKAGILANEP